MITFNLYKFADQLKKEGALMCLDMGTKRTGVAISDKDMRFVQDFFSFNCGGIKSDIEFLLQKIKISSTSGLIIGIPFGHVRKNGWNNFILDFAKKISCASGLSVHLKDESDSTNNAELLMQGFSRKTKKRWKDKLAACCMLEETLDIISFLKTQA